MIMRFYLPLLSTNVKHPNFGCHVASLCQGLRRSAGSGDEDPENQVAPSAERQNAPTVLSLSVHAPFLSNCSCDGKTEKGTFSFI